MLLPDTRAISAFDRFDLALQEDSETPGALVARYRPSPELVIGRLSLSQYIFVTLDTPAWHGMAAWIVTSHRTPASASISQSIRPSYS